MATKVNKPTRANKNNRANTPTKNDKPKGKDKVSEEKKYHAKALLDVPIITAEEAVSMGYTGRDLRVLANSLERIAGDFTNGAVSFEYTKNDKGHTQTARLQDLVNYNSRVNYQRAREFRTLAKMVDMLQG